jgi:pimeloyl-ACP methyl ester carboxylesterase
MSTHLPIHKRLLAGALTVTAVAILAALLWTSTGSARSVGRAHKADAKPTIVLVHGAWADASSWSRVITRLQSDGYTVYAPPDPLRGVANDSAYLASFLETIPGPVVLVGHSYGGAVITNAATSDPEVKALVYVDAFIPDQGQTISQLVSAEPGSQLDPTKSFNFVPFGPGAGDVDLYVKPSIFPEVFANGLSPRLAAELAASQRPLAASALQEPSGPPAWATIPSWSVIGTQDHVIPPAEQVAMSTHAGARITEIDAPHLSMLADPGDVTHVIVKAADTLGWHKSVRPMDDPVRHQPLRDRS